MVTKIIVPLAIKGDGDALERLHFARTSYLRKLIKYDLCPLLVSAEMSESMMRHLYREAAGVMFLGGVDVDATHYGEKNHEKNEIEPARDKMELTLLRWVLEDKKPFLGICRGAQILNVACGGSLIQHLPELGLGEPHAPQGKPSYADLMEQNPSHGVQVEAGSKAHRIVNAAKVTTNSSHHQAIKRLGSGLRASGKTDEGVIEIVEHEESFFCFGLQAHPEAVDSGDLEPFFAEFAKAAKNSAV